MTNRTCLRVVTYHYVRDLPRTPFPRIKGRLLSEFRTQVEWLADQYEIASWETAKAFVEGRYQPQRDLCLLTFDDGLIDHYADVTPLLAERRIQGIFFIPTACIESHHVLLVHKNHFLMASLGFEEYQQAFRTQVAQHAPSTEATLDSAQARRTYRFDSPEVAVFKYWLNFVLEYTVRQSVISELFTHYLGDEREFAKGLYLSWEQARAMQAAGMLMGGHSHHHTALASLDESLQQEDLSENLRLLHQRLDSQWAWPFSYPYGNPADSFTCETAGILDRLGFCAAFTTESGVNYPHQDRFRLRRFDTTDLAA